MCIFFQRELQTKPAQTSSPAQVSALDQNSKNSRDDKPSVQSQEHPKQDITQRKTFGCA